MARRLLARNTGNRPMRRTHVQYLKGVLLRGEWVLNNDAVMISTEGVLLNGQHRLSAVIESGTPARMLVMYDVPPETYKHIDNGIHRSVADLTRLSPPLAADCNLLTVLQRMAAGGGPNVSAKSSAEQVLAVAPWWIPAFNELGRQAKGATPAGLHNTSMRIGFGVRWALSNPEVREVTLRQYGFMLRNEMHDMTVATATLWRKLVEERVRHGGRDMRMRMAAVVYRYTDPTKADVRPQLRDQDELLRTLVVDVERMKQAFTTADGNPVYDVTRPEVRAVSADVFRPGSAKSRRTVYLTPAAAAALAASGE
jgi:hypothetical protein